MAELTGVTVGNYFLLECLGSEGMIESYRARPTTQGGFDVVLRLFRPPFPDLSAFQEHFASEVEKVWHCHHENIQPLIEYGSGEDLLYDVTEFSKDKTLEDVLESGEEGEFFKSIPQIIRLITQVCTALDYAHKQHIVHGNVQPSSLLIQSDQNILLTHFSMKSGYREGEPLVAQIEEGNAAYVAPEQVVGMLTSASDIYAVGVLLFRLLTGHLPYDGESAGEIALKHANEAIPSLRRLRPDLPESVELVVRVALAKSPEARFPNANALAHALFTSIATDRPHIITVKPQRRVEINSRRRTSFTWNGVLSFIAIMLVLFGLIGTLNFFSTLPLHLGNILSSPFHAHSQGRVVETKLHKAPPANVSSGITPSAPIPTPNKISPTLHSKLTPTVGRSNAPTVGVTKIPVIPLVHNLYCPPGTLKLDSSQNLQPLFQQVDADYLNACQGTTISLHGDSSCTSLIKLQDGRFDIAGSDLLANPMRNLTDDPLGAMLYAIIVSPDVTINGLSKAEIQDIFDGHISNWGQVGGANEAITVVLPPNGASINAIFQTYVLTDATKPVDALRVNKDLPALAVQSVLHTPGAISIVPLVIAQENNMRILAIDGVAPSAQTLLDGTYTFWSIEHAYTQSGSTAVIQAYEQFLKSEQEQNVLLAFGVVPINMIDQNVLNNHGSGPEL